MNPAELLTTSLTRADRVAVTGASGWFGTTALDLLLDAWPSDGSERIVGYASSERAIVLPSGRAVRVKALPDLLTDPAPTVLLHFAYLTRDRVADLGVAEYAKRNVSISSLALAAVRQHRPRIVVTASSGAVNEAEGRLAHDLVTNPYGALKVLDELAFAEASRKVGAGWAIPRVFSVAGPGMSRPENYALGSMIAMARAGGPVQITSTRPAFRSYCGVDEVIALSIWAADKRRCGVFDTVGHEVEMADLAATVAGVIGDGCAVSRPGFDPTAAADRYVGDPSTHAALLRDSGLAAASLSALVLRTAARRGS
jgi:nucleoside-diphosphate-sugar epimerase